MTNETDRQDNQDNQNQQTSWQSTSYVYPDSGSGSGQGPSGPNKPQKDPRRSTRFIGILAIVLSAVVIFSAVTGTAVYLLMKDKPDPTSQTQQTSGQTEQTTSPMTDSTTTAAIPTAAPGDLTNPHFSLADAASRHVDGK